MGDFLLPKYDEIFVYPGIGHIHPLFEKTNELVAELLKFSGNSSVLAELNVANDAIKIKMMKIDTAKMNFT